MFCRFTKSNFAHLVVRTFAAAHAFVAWVNLSVLTSVRNIIWQKRLVQISMSIVVFLVALFVKKRENLKEEVNP